MHWIAACRAYDDETLATLANPGLLRRAYKDVEAGKLRWLEEGAQGGLIEADGQRVKLDGHGPQKATCDCPAPGVCKHILAAVLWLREQPVAGDNAVAGGSDEVASAPDPLADLLACAANDLLKAAGVAAVRRAAEMPVIEAEWHGQGGALVITLPALGASCRWIVGAGFAGMVSEIAAKERKLFHLLAVAAVRRAAGLPALWVASPPVFDTAALSGRERAFLAQLRGALDELILAGLSHVGQQTSARLLALNMSARAEGLPRLAALLRNLGGMIDGLAARDHRVEEQDVLTLIAHLHALSEALLAVGEVRDEETAAHMDALRGRLQRNYEAGGALDVLPLGAWWWQTDGGARGLTLAFWDIAGARIVQAALARPDGSDRGFDRDRAWSLTPLWDGAGSAENIGSVPWRLEEVRMAEDGRLAIGGTTRATALPHWSADDARLADVGFGDWAEVSAALRAAGGLTGQRADLMLLRPASVGEPRLDETAQRIEWPVVDTDGRSLNLLLPCEERTRQRMLNLERLYARRAVHGVLVRVSDATHGELEVLTVLSADPKGQLQTISLDYAHEAAPPKAGLGQRILRLLEKRRQQKAPPMLAAPSALARILTPLLAFLETQAALGRLVVSVADGERLQASAGALGAIGLETLRGSLMVHAAAPTTASLLQLHYLCQRVLAMEGLAGIES